ncbi:MAG: carbamoyltransferase C-terminal domain-containing protein [Myxococcota bacterium]
MVTPPRLVLGIADNHDAGACLVADGKLVAAISEERLDRVKNSGAFPHQAIQCVLKLAGVAPDELDAVAVGTTFTPAAPLRLLRDAHHALKDDASQFSYLLHLYILYQVGLKRLGLERLEEGVSRPILRHHLRQDKIKAEIHFVDHHTAHAHSAALTAPFDPALIVTLDAMGDGTSVTVHRSEAGRLTPLFRQSGRTAINTYYSRVTEYLGFKPLRHEGKITGLAAYGRAPEKLLKLMAEQLHFVGPGFNTTDYVRPASLQDPFYRALAGYTREEIAASVQQNLEQQVGAFVSYWCQKSGLSQLAVAGGVFANVKLNQRLLERPEVSRLHVYPHMSDGGLPAGAALKLGGATPGAIETAYLGPEISEVSAEQALRAAGLPFERPQALAEHVASLLAQGKVVARAAGKLEWGPRALGNRSILYRPDDRQVNDWLNKHLRRTEFMPFAPSTLDEAADKLYVGLEGARDAARFMTVCFDCTAEMRRQGAGVVHVDGTARPQLVRAQDNPAYHALLKAFERKTGLSSVINTSFNMHEEPIVATAEDAIKGWQDAGLEVLVLGPFVVRRQA